MTEPYTYASHPSRPALCLQPVPGDGPPTLVLHAYKDGVNIPVTDVHDVIRGILAQAAAAEGRTWTSALAEARDDYTLIHTPGPATPDDQAAHDRLTSGHPPLLLALAEAYTGQDAPLWQEYKRVQGERDASDRKATREYEHAVRLFAANLKLTAETKELRARVAELETALADADRGAALAARDHRRRADIERLTDERDQARARVAEPETRSPGRAEILTAAAEHLRGKLHADVYDDMGQRAANGILRAADELDELAMAGETLARFQAGIVPVADVGRHLGVGTFDNPDDTHTPAMTADQWNARYSSGTPVHAWPGTRDEEPLVTRTRGIAWVLGGHTPVVMVDGYSGGIALTHIEPREDEAPPTP